MLQKEYNITLNFVLNYLVNQDEEKLRKLCSEDFSSTIFWYFDDNYEVISKKKSCKNIDEYIDMLKNGLWKNNKNLDINVIKSYTDKNIVYDNLEVIYDITNYVESIQIGNGLKGYGKYLLKDKQIFDLNKDTLKIKEVYHNIEEKLIELYNHKDYIIIIYYFII